MKFACIVSIHWKHLLTCWVYVALVFRRESSRIFVRCDVQIVAYPICTVVIPIKFLKISYPNKKVNYCNSPRISVCRINYIFQWGNMKSLQKVSFQKLLSNDFQIFKLWKLLRDIHLMFHHKIAFTIVYSFCG